MEPNNQKLTIPAAILIAAAIIGLAIIVVNTKSSAPVNSEKTSNTLTAPAVENQILAPVSSSDRILGNPEAPVILLTYSDPSCPACKMYNENTVKKIYSNYLKSGNLAIVYRHFPFDKPINGVVLHPKAGNEAHAYECAGDQGGNKGFFDFLNKFFLVTESVTAENPDGFPAESLSAVAKSVGLDPVKFDACMQSGKYKSKIEADYQSGLRAGVDSTPYSFIITKNAEPVRLSGFQAYTTLKSLIDALIVKNKGGE